MKTKTDSELQQDVIAQLKFEPSVNAARIGVEVDRGVATLTGKVDSYFEKIDAERAAQRESGVSALAVEIEVAIPGIFARTDEDIARNATSAMESMTNLPKASVKLSGPEVTLSGTVHGWAERNLVAHSAWGTPGDRNVVDQTTLQY